MTLEPLVEGVERPVPQLRLPGAGCRVVPAGRQHRVQREGHEQRHEHGEGHREAELEEEAADDALHERDGHEHRDDRHRRGEDREPDLVGALAGRLEVVLAVFEVPHDVSPARRCVVDEQADRAARGPSASSVFSVIPRKYMMMNAEMTEMGSVSP